VGVWGAASPPKVLPLTFMQFNLETAVVSTHLAQPLDSPGISGESLITNKVTAISPDTPDKSRDYTMHALPTAVSRFKDGFTIG
jgi:hypothetical protein